MLLSLCKNLLHCRGNGHITVKPDNPSMAVSLSLIRFFSGDGDDTHSFTVSYLINSCGFSPKSALSASKGVNLKSSKQPDSVLSCFQKLGFSKTQISEMVRKQPRILNCNLEKTIFPKVDFFRSKGASTPELVEIFTTNPRILRESLENHLVPAFNMLAELTQSESKALEMIRINPYVLSYRPEARLMPNISTLLENGVPSSNIMLLCHRFNPSILTNPVKFRKIVEEVKEIGFNPLKSTFVTAIKALTSLSKPKWDRRVEVFKSWGWSKEDFAKAFRKHPVCIAYSDEKIMTAMDFFVNQLGLDSSVLANCPVLLGYSLNKRLIPRGAVFRFLLSKGLIKLDSKVRNLFIYSEKLFFERFVNCHKEAPLLTKLYIDKLLEATGKEKTKS